MLLIRWCLLDDAHLVVTKNQDFLDLSLEVYNASVSISRCNSEPLELAAGSSATESTES